jgi:hypothetical protein
MGQNITKQYHGNVQLLSVSVHRDQRIEPVAAAKQGVLHGAAMSFHLSLLSFAFVYHVLYVCFNRFALACHVVQCQSGSSPLADATFSLSQTASPASPALPLSRLRPTPTMAGAITTKEELAGLSSQVSSPQTSPGQVFGVRW